jgi:hypothetical protein
VQNDDKYILPAAKASEEDIGKNAEKAVAYLKRTDNLDTVDILGLSTYLEEADEQEDEEGPDSGGPAGGE